MNDLLHHFLEQRPWGTFEQFTLNESSTVKIITVECGQAFSLQKHNHRSEFWKILSGEGFITHGETKEPLEVNKSYFLPEGTLHRIEATTSPVVFLEIAFGTFDETDIERLEDNYGRS